MKYIRFWKRHMGKEKAVDSTNFLRVNYTKLIETPWFAPLFTCLWPRPRLFLYLCSSGHSSQATLHSDKPPSIQHKTMRVLSIAAILKEIKIRKKTEMEFWKDFQNFYAKNETSYLVWNFSIGNIFLIWIDFAKNYSKP